MKTPDFDDLLAAFDIPDIDANEAIQSESGDPDAHPGEARGGGTKERSGGPNQRPVGPSEIRETSHDPSVVSVIVKNSICAYDEEQNAVRQVSDVLDDADRSRTGGHLSPQVAHSLMPMDPLIHNGFKAVPGGLVESSLLSGQSQMQPKGHLWPPCSPKIAREGDESNQDDGPSNSSVSFSPHMPLPASVSSVSCTNFISLPPSDVNKDEVEHPASAFSPQNQPLNSGSKTDINPVLSEDEDSDPDLGSSPLMIQESPDVQMSSPLRFPGRHGSSDELQPPPPSSPSLPESNSQTGETTSVSPHPAPLVSHQTPPENTTPEQTHPSIPEVYPEHIIEERDSPESPEPEMPSCPQWKSTSTPAQEVGEKEPVQDKTLVGPDKEEPMENARNGQESSKCDTDKVEKDNMVEPEEQESSVMVSVASGEKRSAFSAVPSRPLKVRIKTVKSPTGNITRTVTRVAAKGGAAGISKSPDGSKVPIGGRKGVGKPKRPAATMSGQPRDSKSTILPVSTLQDASSAMLFAASKAQKVASNVAKASTSPTVSSSSPSSSAINICSIGQKTVAVSSTKPASIVNSPGAVISRSQSNLVEAFNKILNSKNLLPSYQPDLSILPRPEWGLGVPASGYRCLECGDAFALERSLARHYDRRSLRIEVTCNLCTKRLAFFNKCSLLLHAREHKEKGLVMQCSHLVMRPVSVEQMIGQQDTVPIGKLVMYHLLSCSVQMYMERGPKNVYCIHFDMRNISA